MRTFLLSLLLTFTVACDGESDTDTDTSDTADTSDTDTDTDTATPDCETVAAADCAKTDGCATISGRDVTEADCIDFSADRTPYGCMSAEGGCGDAETWARPSNEEDCVLFPSTCTPAGWIVCDFQDVPECSQP